MKWLPLKALLLCIALQTQVVAAEYKGAGSSISTSLLKTWAISYNAKNSFNYESSSSKAGIEQLSLGKVDFAASDEALPLAELNAKHLIQFPFVMGAVVPVVNLPGVSDGAVILSPEILAGMYSGQIKRWRDPLILALNPELEGKMPDLPVLPIYRKSGSGTNFIFTSYLSRSPSWKNGKIGVSFDMIGASGQGEDSADAVLSQLQQTRGAVSYLDYARVQKNKLNATRLTGPLQMVVKVSPDNIRKAAHEVAEQSLYSRRKISINLVNIESTGWPMSNFTFLVMRENLPTEHRQAIVNFISWGFSKEGREIVQERGYIELSGVMQSAVRGFLGDAYKINLALN